MDNNALEPCPFCGSAAYTGVHPYYPDKFIANCGRPEGVACIFPSTGPVDTLEEALSLWNTRAAIQSLPTPHICFCDGCQGNGQCYNSAPDKRIELARVGLSRIANYRS